MMCMELIYLKSVGIISNKKQNRKGVSDKMVSTDNEFKGANTINKKQTANNEGIVEKTKEFFTEKKDKEAVTGTFSLTPKKETVKEEPKEGLMEKAKEYFTSSKKTEAEAPKETLPPREELPRPPFSHGDVVLECRAINGFTPHFATVCDYQDAHPEAKTAHDLAVLITNDSKSDNPKHAMHGWWGK